MGGPVSKESLLRQVDALRDLSRRSRKVADLMEAESDRQRLNRHAVELDDNATRIEKAAIDARTGVQSPFAVSGARGTARPLRDGGA